MPRRGHSTTIGKFAKLYQDRRASEIRALGELLRREQRTTRDDNSPPRERRQAPAAR